MNLQELFVEAVIAVIFTAILSFMFKKLKNIVEVNFEGRRH